MRLHYSIAARLGSGIGHTAQMQIEGAEDAGFEVGAVTLDGRPGLGSLPPLVRDNAFDSLATVQMEDHDVFHGWSQHSLCQMLMSKGLGRVRFLQRGSHHILHQREVLREEFRRLGIEREPVPGLAVQKELLEYEVADVIVVPSRSCWESFDRYGLGDKTEVVGFGVDVDHFRPTTGEGDGFTLLFLGGNVVRKGLVYALRAWGRAGLEGRFLVGGRDDVPFPAPEGVEATGHVEDVRGLYRRADALVLPSLEEGQSLTVWEAMASGLPVIVSDACGFNGIIEDGREGYVVPPRDEGGLAAAMGELANDPGLREGMGARGRETAEAHPWSNHQEGLVEMWRRGAGE